MVKLHYFFFMNFGLGFLKHFGGNVELCVIDECSMKQDEIRVNWQDKWKGKKGRPQERSWLAIEGSNQEGKIMCFAKQ